MRRILASSILALAALTAQAADPGDSGPAMKAAAAWLTTIDAGNYAEGWKATAPLFQKAAPEATWEGAVRPMRGRLGKLVSRELKNAQYTTSLPGAPDGHYWLLQEHSSFENYPKVLETITLVEMDGGWKVTGYFINQDI